MEIEVEKKELKFKPIDAHDDIKNFLNEVANLKNSKRDDRKKRKEITRSITSYRNGKQRQRQLANKQYQNLSRIEHTNYHLPVTFTRKFEEVDNTLKAYVYFFDYEEIGMSFCLLSGASLGILPDLKLFRNPYDKEKRDLVRVVYAGRKTFEKKKFMEYFKFYVCFNADLYGISQLKIPKFFFTLNKNDESTRNYFWIPAKKIMQKNIFKSFAIDDAIIEELDEFKRTNGKNSEKLSDILAEFDDYTLPQDHDLLTGSIYTSTWGTKQNYMVYSVLNKPEKLTAFNFFTEMALLANHKPELQEIIARYQLKEGIDKKSLNYLLYEAETQKKKPCLTGFRDLYKMYEILVDKKKPVILADNIKGKPFYFNFLNPVEGKTYSTEFRREKPDLTNPYLCVLPSEYLVRYPISLSQIDKYCRIPSICLEIERYVFANELRQMKNIIAHPQDVITATNSPSYDNENNYETLELVGDSALKFISSYALYVHYPNKNESYYTNQRSKFICNSFLMKLGQSNFLQFFLRTRRRLVTDWRAPYLRGSMASYKECENQVSGKQVADCVEALIGACIVVNYKIEDVLFFLDALGYDLANKYPYKKRLASVSILIPQKFFTACKEKIKEKSTFRQVFTIGARIGFDIGQYSNEPANNEAQQVCGSAYFGINKILKTRDITYPGDPQTFTFLYSQVMRQFETQVLNYSFKHKKLLFQALTVTTNQQVPFLVKDYESEEFLGDALLEPYVITTGYKIFFERGVKMTPELLHQLKVILLGNKFMARMTVLMGLHRYMIIDNFNKEQEINEFISSVSLDIPFSIFLTKSIKIPKVLSDLYESLAGALFLDGGWEAIHQVFGRILAPCILYICDNFDKMVFNFCATLKEVCKRRNLIPDIRKSYNNSDGKVIYRTTIFINEKQLAQFDHENLSVCKEQACLLALDGLDKNLHLD